MSAIYFHTEHATAKVSGAERAHMGLCIRERVMRSIRSIGGGFGYAIPSIQKPLMTDRDWRFASLAMDWQDEYLLDSKGGRHNTFELILNDMLRVSDEAGKLLARIHGQCEIHGFIEWANLPWLADIIDLGLTSGQMRRKMGWESVTALCDEAKGPMVMSYSVTEGWPNPDRTNWSPPAFNGDEDDAIDGKWEAWEKLSPEQQWLFGMDHLREHAHSLELQPDTFDDFYFGDGFVVDDLGWYRPLVERA